MGSHIVWEDQWGDAIDRPAADLVEIRWHDTTRHLDKDTFQQWLSRFAGAVEDAGRSGILTDATRFLMAREHMDGDWRDANITPRYNAAGVKRFAFLMPDGMPAIGAPPAPEGRAAFPTAYFGTRASALEWLARG